MRNVEDAAKEIADREDRRVLDELRKLSTKTSAEALEDLGVTERKLGDGRDGSDIDMATPREPVDPLASPVSVGEGVMPVLREQEKRLVDAEEKIAAIGKRTETAFLTFVQPEGEAGPEHPVSVMTRQGLMPLMCFSEEQLPSVLHSAQQVADNSGARVLIRRFTANLDTTGDIVIERRLVKVAASDALSMRGADRVGLGGRKIG